MSELFCLLGDHPFLAGLFLLCASPVFISLLVLFSPILVTFLFFSLGLAGLARSRRGLRHRSSRRRRKNADFWQPDGGEGLADEKQRRVELYLEDQLRHLVMLQDSSIWSGIADAPVSGDRLGPVSVVEKWPWSDVSVVGDESDAVVVDEDEDGDDH